MKVKKINAGAKRDLLNSVIKTDEKDDPSLDEINVTGLKNLINVIKRYENMIKQRRRRLLNCYTSKEKYLKSSKILSIFLRQWVSLNPPLLKKYFYTKL